MKPKRIRLCFFAPARSIHTFRWVSAFAEHRNFQITLISTYDAPSGQSFPESVQFILMRPPPPNQPALMRHLSVLRNYSTMRRFVIQQKFDLFHVHQVPPARTAFFFYYIPRLILSPWGTDIARIGDSLPARFLSLSQRYLIKNAKAITASSDFLANATRCFASPKTPIYVIPFGVNTRRFKNEGKFRKRSPVRIAVTKNLESRYGLIYLLDALAQVRNVRSDVILTIAGSGSLENALRNQMHRLDLEDCVEFTGSLSQQGVTELLHRSHIFAMPSLRESFGVAALEAMASGLPVVASNVGGIPEIVKDGKTGILVPPGDAAALADAILRLIKNPELKEQMGHAGRERVCKLFEWKDCVDRMEQVYRSVLDAA